jgi:hypothetical protein
MARKTIRTPSLAGKNLDKILSRPSFDPGTLVAEDI